MRNAFIHTLTKLAQENENIYLLTGDLGYSVFEDFQKKFPKRFINMGLSEQNMIGVAAGLALSGKIVFTYSIIPFLILRCLEQIRNDICYHHLNVKLIGVGSGFSYGVNGHTHYALEDIAIMKSLSPLTILSPGDPLEVEGGVKSAIEQRGPLYLRLGKNGEPIIHKGHKNNFKFEIGKGITIRDGKDITLFVTGNLLEVATCVTDILEKSGMDVRLISMPSLKPIDKEIIFKASEETKAIFTMEEHLIEGGLGSSVLEVLFQHQRSIPFKKFGVKKLMGHRIGNHHYLRKVHGLTADGIISEILAFIKERCNEHFYHRDLFRNRQGDSRPPR